MKQDWYKPSEIHYDRDSVVWLLQHAVMLREGKYPPEGRESGYVGGSGKPVSYHASFELACQIIAEVDSRLAMCGLDRELVEKYYTDCVKEAELAKRYHMDVFEVFRRIDHAVSYISSGKCPRWLACAECGEDSRCRKRKRLVEHGEVKITYTYQQWENYKNKEEGRGTSYKIHHIGVAHLTNRSRGLKVKM